MPRRMPAVKIQDPRMPGNVMKWNKLNNSVISTTRTAQTMDAATKALRQPDKFG